jgi:acyl-CoA dehydrogenase
VLKCYKGEGVNFELSEKTRDFRKRVEAFMDELVYPNEARFQEQLDAADSRWSAPPVMEEMKEEAKARGLWNLFLPPASPTWSTRPCARSWAAAP